ncbi:hypothetical protein IFM89_035621, partial [Coptis chinensis]
DYEFIKLRSGELLLLRGKKEIGYYAMGASLVLNISRLLLLGPGPIQVAYPSYVLMIWK